MLPLILMIALDGAAALSPPTGAYRYDAIIDRKPAGHTTVTLSNTAQGTKLEEYSESHLPTGDTYAHSTLMMGASLIPAAYRASYKIQDEQMQVVVAFQNRSATVTAGTDVRTFVLGGSSQSFVILDASMASGFLMLPSQMRAFKDADTTAVVPGLGVVTFLSVLQGVTPLRPERVPPRDVSVSFAGEAPFVEWYDPATLIVDEVDVPGQNLALVRRR